MKCKTSRKEDLNQMASCHRAAFPKSLSSLLSHFYTIKLLSWYLVDPRGVLFHVEDEGKIIGYCGAIKTQSPGLEGSSTSMTQYSFHTMLKALALKPWLIFHPENAKRIPFIKKNIQLKLGIKKRTNTSANTTEPFVPFWGLVVIGVDPTYQSKGIGSLLLQEFERLAKEDHVERIYLSVKQGNSKAIKSYKRNGWLIQTNNQDSLTMYKKL